MLKNKLTFFKQNLSYDELTKRKIKISKEIFENFKDFFLKDKKFLGLLEKFKKTTQKNHQLLEELKSYDECYICTVLEKKGCCKAGIETEITINILLINLFLSIQPPEEREISGMCFFAGPKGCKLFARAYICRDYFCKRLLNKFSQEDYVKITQNISEELGLLYALSSYIKSELEYLCGEFLMELDITG